MLSYRRLLRSNHVVISSYVDMLTTRIGIVRDACNQVLSKVLSLVFTPSLSFHPAIYDRFNPRISSFIFFLPGYREMTIHRSSSDVARYRFFASSLSSSGIFECTWTHDTTIIRRWDNFSRANFSKVSIRRHEFPAGSLRTTNASVDFITNRFFFFGSIIYVSGNGCLRGGLHGFSGGK